jgi:hypothetical protein
MRFSPQGFPAASPPPHYPTQPSKKEEKRTRKNRGKPTRERNPERKETDFRERKRVERGERESMHPKSHSHHQQCTSNSPPPLFLSS